MFSSMSNFPVAAFASLSASLFPSMPLWLGSQTKVTFFLYLFKIFLPLLVDLVYKYFCQTYSLQVYV